MTDTHHSTKGIGAQTHVGILTHSLKALALLLHGIVIATEAIDLQLGSLNLTTLTSTLAFYQSSFCTDAGTCGDLLQQFFIKFRRIDNDLDVLNGRAIIQGDKVDSLRAAVRTHPALHADALTIICALQHINYLCTFHFQLLIVKYRLSITHMHPCADGQLPPQ